VTSKCCAGLEHGDAGWNPVHVLNKAAASGSVEMTAWVARQPGVKLMASTMCAAAENGCTAVCEYLLSQHCPLTAYACTRAAAGDHLSMLLWLRDNGCPWDVDAVCTAAVRGGSVEVSAYLQQQEIVSPVAQLTDMLSMLHCLVVGYSSKAVQSAMCSGVTCCSIM
jgi:hypothetical protein